MSVKKFFAAAALVALASAPCCAVEAPKDDLFSWTPTHGARMARAPFTTRFPARGRYVAVGDSQYSGLAGFKILEKGGNAFDAAVAMAAVMTFTNPTANDMLGGDSMIIVYSAKDKKVVTYNGTGWAPRKATIDAYIDKGGIPMTGILSTEVPGSFSGWMTMLRDYGSMKLSDIFAPAVDLAENGHPLGQAVAQMGAASYKNMNDAAKAVYGRDGKLAAEGTRIKNSDYAKTLREMSGMSYQEAEDYFYRGPIAREIAAFSKANGGFVEYEDLAEFHAEKVDAHSTNFRGIDVYVCPPNSQGWVLLETLNLLEPYDLKKMGHNSAEYIDLVVQALNLSLQDRNHFIADPRFHKNPTAMIGKQYAEERRKDLHPGKAMDGELSVGNPADTSKFGDIFYGKSGDTTFLAVADAEGNVVACTTSLCTAFGSCQMVPGRGFFLNNRMTYFFLDTELANYLEPRKRTVQTITPSIALKDGTPQLAFGTPGADVQEQAKIQVFLNCTLFGMDPQQAVEAPRFQSRHPMGIMGHATYPKTVQVEGRVSESVRKDLAEKYGYTVQTSGEWEYVGIMGAIGWDGEGFAVGGADPRIDSRAYAW